MSVAERLEASVAESRPASLDSLGTASEVAAEAAALAAGAYAPDLALVFRDSLQREGWTEDHSTAFLNFAAGLGQQRSDLALRDTTDILLEDEPALKLVATALHDALFPDTEIIAAEPLLAGVRLDVVLAVVAQKDLDVAPYRVQTLLAGSVRNYPEDFEDPLARALGVALDLWSNPSDRNHFIRVLAALAERGNEDAAYETAMAQLRDALAEEDKEDLLRKVHTVRDKFEALSRQFEGRDDAAAFAHACTALIAFDMADKDTLTATAQAARMVADRRALHNRGMHKRQQTMARHTAELAWTSLAWRLETAAKEIENDAFLNTWEGVDAIINVYNADREFTNLRTVNTLIRPKLINEIAQREAMQHQLERAVAADNKRDQPQLPREVHELLGLVHRARSAGRESSDAPEESSHESVCLRALLGPGAYLLNKLPAPHLAQLEAAARQNFAGNPVGSALIERLTAHLVEDLEANEAFTGSARYNFSLLVLHTVRFLVYVGDNAQPYIRLITRENPAPLEAELQEHFHQALCLSEFAGRVTIEHSRISGGRADIVTTFDGAQRYVTEVKRELVDASKKNLNDQYLAQALEYQSTNVPLGQLLVLDLTDHSSGTPHIEDSIWVVHRANSEGHIRNSAVVAVVRGNRPTPSKMK